MGSQESLSKKFERLFLFVFDAGHLNLANNFPNQQFIFKLEAAFKNITG